MKSLIIAAAAAALVNPLAPAAAGVNEDVQLCRAAIDARPDLTQHSATFERIKGGKTRTLRFALNPGAGGGESLIATCTINKGVVVELAVEPA
ncbi:MAG: hypothetical protein WD076_08995 [Parvularculaceae bacterium]